VEQEHDVGEPSEHLRGRRPVDDNRHWVGTWAASPAPSEAGVGFANHTLRMNPRVSIGGDTVRVRISNAYGSRKLEIGEAYVDIRGKGPGIVPRGGCELTFNGSRSASVPAGAIDRKSTRLNSSHS